MSQTTADKVCPYCQRPVRSGMPVTVCPACQSTHHYACWRENGGCANPRCASVSAGDPPVSAPEPEPVIASPSTPANTETLELPTAAVMPAMPDMPLDPMVSRLLAAALTQLELGELTKAATQLEEVKRLAPEHPAVLEAEGDLAFAQRRFPMAERLYRQALQSTPGSAIIEEKYANAVIKVHEPEMLAHAMDVPDDDETWWSQRVARPLWAPITASVILPGIGQIVNGEFLKGAGMLFGNLLIQSYIYYPIYREMGKQLKNEQYGASDVIIANAMRSFFSGTTAIWTCLLIILWIYGIVDAFLVAKQLNDAKKIIPE